jgi:beta-glucosidase-like glycosyl hydrolase
MARTQPQHRLGRLRKDALNVIGAIYLIASRRPDLLEAMGRVMVEEQPPRGEQEPATDTA